MARKGKRPLADLMTRGRWRQQCTLDQMAARTRLCKSGLWEMEKGVQRNPRLTTLLAVCREYGFPISRVAMPRLPPPGTAR